MEGCVWEIRHMVVKPDGSEELVCTTGEQPGIIGKQVTFNPLRPGDEALLADRYLIPLDTPKPLQLSADSAQNRLVFRYREADTRSYTVRHLNAATGLQLMQDKTVSATNLAVVTELAPEIENFVPLEQYITRTLSAGSNQLVFRYAFDSTSGGDAESAVPGMPPGDTPKTDDPSDAMLHLSAMLLSGACLLYTTQRRRHLR